MSNRSHIMPVGAFIPFTFTISRCWYRCIIVYVYHEHITRNTTFAMFTICPGIIYGLVTRTITFQRMVMVCHQAQLLWLTAVCCRSPVLNSDSLSHTGFGIVAKRDAQTLLQWGRALTCSLYASLKRDKQRLITRKKNTFQKYQICVGFIHTLTKDETGT